MAYSTLSRRAFLQWSLVASTAALAGPGLVPLLSKDAMAQTAEGELVIPTCSTIDCGGKCVIKAHVRDGVLTRISTRAPGELDEKNPVMRACLRGRSYRKHMYHPDRLKYPMKRTGKRGEGTFERITWDEALDIIAERDKTLTEKYGPASRFIHVGTAGTGGSFIPTDAAKRYLNLTGGHLPYYHSVSMGNTAAATVATYGIANTGSSLDALADTQLVILWGHNPTETIFGHTNHYYQKMKDRGCKFIVVDPRYSDSAIAYADEWIPLLPNTDSALMDAMAQVIISENLHDQAFLDACCQGFDDDHLPAGVPEGESVVSYLFGKKDGVTKTPEWAEGICKVPAHVIRRLAREYATTKPAALIQGWGPQRHSGGEQSVRGAILLCCLTGNVGKTGGWAGGYGGIQRRFPGGCPVPPNPVQGKINVMQWTDAIQDYRTVKPEEGLQNADKLDVGIKQLWSLGGNYLASQNPDINMTRKLLEDESLVEFILVQDIFMTPSARFADVLLPSCTFFETWDLGGSWGSGDYFMLSQKVVEPWFESRTAYEWLCDLAHRRGVGEAFSEGRTQEQWVRLLVDEARKADPSVRSWEDMQRDNVHMFRYEGPRVPFREQVADPKAHPFSTPSGKIELFSAALYERKDPLVPAIPRYITAWEGPEDARIEKYPLQVIGWKTKQRDNSSFFNHPWLKQVGEQVMWINPLDADKRDIKPGDRVKVFNDRGALYIKAEVTPRIIPGVVSIPAGAWYNPGPDGVDLNGCLNVLTTARKTPLAHGNAHHSVLAEVAKA